MLLKALPHDSPNAHLDREAHCSLFLRTKVTEVTQGKLLFVQKPQAQRRVTQRELTKHCHNHRSACLGLLG